MHTGAQISTQGPTLVCELGYLLDSYYFHTLP